MLLLADFSVMNPSFGLLFWTTIVFLLVWLFIGKTTFKPIVKALKEREDSIENALHEADKARAEMRQLQSHHEELLKQAREERAKIVKEAEELRDRIIKEAETKAEEVSRRSIDNAKQEIENRRKEMEQNLYNHIGQLSLQIAEHLIHRELDGKHEAFIQQSVEEFKQKRQAQLN